MKSTRTSGFTILEVLVALGLFSISMSVAVSSLVNNLRSNRSTQVRYEAIQAAQTVLDQLRFEDISTLNTAFQQNVPIGSRTYSVAISYCRNPAFCISDEIRHITADVSYKSALIYETDTVFSKFK